MRILISLAIIAVVAACTPPAPTTDATADMGPMPPVAALYDRSEPPTTADELDYYFTSDVTAAMTAETTPVDFDFRTWANDPEVIGQTFALDEHPPENRAVVTTRFTSPGVGSGMIMSYTLCRRGTSDWQIENVSAVALPSETDAGAAPETLPSLREILSLPAQSQACD